MPPDRTGSGPSTRSSPRLGTEFGQRVKEGMKSAALLLDDADELAGLPADDVAGAAEAAPRSRT